jgi:diaminohydroxyphosphoribosylaminopyrimidine deaminase/5-amino-6-(5-phosphoribosylamino)uracil reductase
MIAKRKITRLLVEGGSRLAATFLRAKRVDRLAWFRAPSMIGGDGYPVALPFGVEDLPDMRKFRRERVVSLDDDVLETYIVSG